MKNREDIQALRGIAVLLVVLFHVRLNLLSAGYLGVDIFFVISGFLITSMVTNQIRRGSFSFGEFYFRRAKRLLPAAYTTFLITALLSMWLLTSQEFKQFTQQLWGAVTFTSNIVLWRQGSYFGGEAELKPLLHTWSLAIEEQYYLALPAALYFIPVRHWLKSVLLVLVASAVLCMAVMAWKPDVAFYMFPTRAWELAVGSLGVFLHRHPKTEIWARHLFWPALLLMLVLPVFPLSSKHPGIDAWLVCWATLVVILAQYPLMNRGRVVGVLARVGDWSYSLYLVHWPIFALASNVWVGDLPVWVKWTWSRVVHHAGVVAVHLHRKSDPSRTHGTHCGARRCDCLCFLRVDVGAISVPDQSGCAAGVCRHSARQYRLVTSMRVQRQFPAECGMPKRRKSHNLGVGGFICDAFDSGHQA